MNSFFMQIIGTNVGGSKIYNVTMAGSICSAKPNLEMLLQNGTTAQSPMHVQKHAQKQEV